MRALANLLGANRQGAIGFVLALGLVLGLALQASWAGWGGRNTPAWPQWEGFKQAFVSADGRVVDHSMDDLRTVSEGQAYALFFALVAQDQTAFDTLLRWTENNLAGGDLSKNLPAWHWAKQGDTWGVVDNNSASDADLIMVYCLLEAARVFKNPTYQQKAWALGQLVLQRETLWVEGLGLSLLPGYMGFVGQQGEVKLNPSYVPPFVLTRLAQAWPEEPRWAQLWLGSMQLLMRAQTNGYYPDWVVFQQGRPIRDLHWTEGDFDAIRVYLWLGLGPSSNPLLPALQQLSNGYTQRVQSIGGVPLGWNPSEQTSTTDLGPEGFQWALKPLMGKNLQTPPKLEALDSVQAWRDYGYYSSALALFAQGFERRHYRLGDQGQLLLGREAKP